MNIDMRPEDLFPEDPAPDPQKQLAATGSPPRIDPTRPQWLYRRLSAADLTPDEARRLFAPEPRAAVRKLVSFAALARGKAWATLLDMRVPEPPTPNVPRTRLTRAALALAERFDLVPRDAVRAAEERTDMLVARAAATARMTFAEEVVREGEAYIASLPREDAPTREGSRDGARMVAVWSGPKEPTEEPEF